MDPGGTLNVTVAMKHRVHPLHRPWAIWLALLVAVLSAMAPAPSRGWGNTAERLRVDICTSPGPHQLTLAETPDASGSLETGLRAEHCSLCMPATHPAAPPRVAALLRPDGQDTLAIPLAGRFAPSSGHSRTRPQPRAPPHA